MSEATQAAARAKAAKAGPATAEAAADAAREASAPLFNMLDRSLRQARDAHERLTEVFESTTEAMEDVFSIAIRGSAECRTKMMEMARANTNATFDMMRELMAVKSLPEFVELSTSQARRQFETAQAQMRELSELTQRVAVETAAPLRSTMSQPFKLAS